MPLLPFPASARVTDFTIRATFPGQSVLTGVTGGVSVVTRSHSWAGSVGIAPVDPRSDPETAGEIGAFVAGWATPAATAEIPMVGDPIPAPLSLGQITVRADGSLWYAASPAQLVAGQWGRVGNVLFQVGGVEAAAVRLLPQAALAAPATLAPATTVLARTDVAQRTTPGTVRLPDRAGPWRLTWIAAEVA